jgi:hypothetical protein
MKCTHKLILLKVGVRKVLVLLSKTIIVKDLSKITGSELLEVQKKIVQNYSNANLSNRLLPIIRL